MKKKIVPVLFTISSSVLLSSCLNDLYDKFGDSASPKDISELTVPSDFDWKTTRNILVNITTPESYSQLLYTVSIFDKSPEDGGRLITRFSAKAGKNEPQTITLAQAASDLYIQLSSPDGTVTGKNAQISSDSVNVDFSQKNIVKSADASYVALPESFDVKFKNSDSNMELTIPWNVDKDMTYYVPEEVTYNGSLSFNNWKNYNLTLYVKGKLNITSGVNINKVNIVVLEGGSVTINGYVSTGSAPANSNLILVQKNASFTVNGTLNYSNPNRILNFGTFTITDFDQNNSSIFENYGMLRTTNSLKVTNVAKLYNYGSTRSDNYLEINSSGRVENSCKMNVGSKSYIANDGSQYIGADGTLFETDQFETSGGQIYLGKNAILRSNSANLEGVQIYGSTEGSALCQFNNIGIVGASVGLHNRLQVAYKSFSGTAWHLNNLNALARNSISIVLGPPTCNIEATDCNGAEQKPQISDSDKDGIPDGQDEFPDDANKAHYSYFPGEKSWGTYVFEDLWPSLGDYDMNDMVLNFRITYITNSDNKVTQMLFTYKVKAIGASLAPCGIGFQLDKISPNAISSVKGSKLDGGYRFAVNDNGLEKAQGKAVIPLFEKSSDVISVVRAGEMFNTVPGGGKATGEENTITITFAEGQDKKDLSPNDNINVFTVNETSAKRKEIHLPGFTPSSLANKSFFNTENDGSDLNNHKYFYSKADAKGKNGNLMWGLMLPVDFEYPVEKSSILDVYKRFGQWANSGGKLYQDWYSNTSSEYRNTSLIYK